MCDRNDELSLGSRELMPCRKFFSSSLFTYKEQPGLLSFSDKIIEIEVTIKFYPLTYIGLGISINNFVSLYILALKRLNPYTIPYRLRQVMIMSNDYKKPSIQSRAVRQCYSQYSGARSTTGISKC